MSSGLAAWNMEWPLDLQNRLVEQYLCGTGSEKLLLLEHEPVYTIGRTRDQSSLRSASAAPSGFRDQSRADKRPGTDPASLLPIPSWTSIATDGIFIAICDFLKKSSSSPAGVRRGRATAEKVSPVSGSATGKSHRLASESDAGWPCTGSHSTWTGRRSSRSCILRHAGSLAWK